MQIPTSFTVLPSNQTGQVYGTEFKFTANLPSDFNVFAWTFGDNVSDYNKSTVTHIYRYPGLYTVSLSAWNDAGVIYTDAATIDVDYAFRDIITFSNIPDKFGVPGLKAEEPFVVSLTSAKIDQPLSIVLQPFNTRSVPHYAIPEKWKFLTPKWRFVDASTNQTLDGPINLSSTPIYNEENRIIAVRAEASFYYIDDLSTGLDPNFDCPLMITATLSTERFSYPNESLIYPYASYSNSEVARAAIAWQINDTIPTRLKISENYLNDIYPTKWAGVPIPVMITCQSDTSLLSSFSDLPQYDTVALSYPRTNELGSLFPVTLTLSSDVISDDEITSYYKVDEAPLYFKASDEYDNIASGYIFTTITPLSPIEGNVVINATTISSNRSASLISFNFPAGYPIYPDVYISHPAKSTINKINIVSYPKTCTTINYYKSLGVLSEGSMVYVTVPTLTSTDLTNYTLSGSSGVYGMAFNPVKNRLYTCDVDQNIVSMYESGTKLLTSIRLDSIFQNETLAPSYISVDAYSNVWISLFDDHRVIKLDSNLNYLLSAAPLVSDDDEFGVLERDEEESFITLEDGSLINEDIIRGDTFNSPPIVETDMMNDVWVCYPDPLDSMLAKFDSNGNELFKSNDLPGNSIPVSLAIDVTNKLWVACKNTNSIMQFDSQGTMLQTITGFWRPSYIAMNSSNNVWVAHGYNLCSVYNTVTTEVSTWRITTLPTKSVERVYEYTTEDITLPLHEDEIWGGLAIDVYDRVWLVDSVKNVAITFGTNDPSNYRMLEIVPTADTKHIIKTGDNFVTDIPSNNVRSAQAGGDWTGNRWYQKYTGGYGSLPIEGKSKPFKIYDLNNSFQLTKVNEEFDFASYFKSLTFPEHMRQNTAFFEEFLPAVVGDGNPTTESIGRVAYERIANFISTHGDYETAEIDKLVSIANGMGVDTKNFGTSFPAAINRLLNIFSVPKQRLKGILNLESDISSNIGTLVTETSLITADQYYFIKDKIYGNYQLMYADQLSGGETTYPISDIDVEGLRLPITDNYHIFQYNDQNNTGYTGNLINWYSPYTTVSDTLSSHEEWYGDNGLVETMFNNLLTKQLYQQ